MIISRLGSLSQTKWGFRVTNIDFPEVTFPLWREFERPLKALDWWLDSAGSGPDTIRVFKLSGAVVVRNVSMLVICSRTFLVAVIVGTLKLCRQFNHVGCWMLMESSSTEL